jgi:hypothetical protein
MNSCTFILECSRGRGRMLGAFSEQTMAACSYRGELLGLLLAIHLILLSINKINPTLTGSVHIYSDCLGALNKVKNLPPHRIPSKCRHSDVLKMIMIQCSAMSFDRLFSHVPAHQDDIEDFESLSQEAQLNCACDFGAKRVLLNHNPDDLPWQQQFPLEPISVWAGREKMTSDTGSSVRFHTHKNLARKEFNAAGILPIAHPTILLSGLGNGAQCAHIGAQNVSGLGVQVSLGDRRYKQRAGTLVKCLSIVPQLQAST